MTRLPAALAMTTLVEAVRQDARSAAVTVEHQLTVVLRRGIAVSVTSTVPRVVRLGAGQIATANAVVRC